MSQPGSRLCTVILVVTTGVTSDNRGVCCHNRADCHNWATTTHNWYNQGEPLPKRGVRCGVCPRMRRGGARVWAVNRVRGGLLQ